MVWCRAGLRGDFLSGYTDLFSSHKSSHTNETRMHYTMCCMLVFIIQDQFVTSFYKSNFLFYQSALTMQQSTNLFCFLWVSKPQTAHKGGAWAGIC